MANTEKQNFRCDGKTRWNPAMAKLAEMRRQGYDIDMTKVLSDRVDWVRDASVDEIAEAFGMVATR